MAATPVDLVPHDTPDAGAALASLLGVGVGVGVERVARDDNFFDQHGPDSLVLACFCARARKRPDLPSQSMRDVYDHPTAARLAAALARRPGSEPAREPEEGAAPVELAPSGGPGRVGTAGYVLCGVLQFLTFVAYTYGFAIATTLSYQYVVAGGLGLVSLYVRAVEAGAAIFLAMCLLPVAAKWLLVGRWRSREIRLWSPLNFGTVVQCHSQEDGAFKSDRSTVEARAALGVAAFVHYGVTVGEGAELAAGTFVMKGEEVPRDARWDGNPARDAAARPPDFRLAARGVPS